MKRQAHFVKRKAHFVKRNPIFLIRSALFLCLCASVAAPAAADLAKAIDATARITVRTAQGEGKGTGTVFEIGQGYVYLLTCAHVVDGATDVSCEFWQGGHQSQPMAARVVMRSPGELDAAVVAVPESSFAGRLPPVIPVAPRGTQLTPGEMVCSAGCPRGSWTTGWKGHVVSSDASTLQFLPPPAEGRSGSAVLDAQAERIVGLLKARRINEPVVGIATSLEGIYRGLTRQTGEAEPRPIGPEAVNVPYMAGTAYDGPGNLAGGCPGGACPGGSCPPQRRPLLPVPRQPRPQESPYGQAPQPQPGPETGGTIPWPTLPPSASPAPATPAPSSPILPIPPATPQPVPPVIVAPITPACPYADQIAAIRADLDRAVAQLAGTASAADAAAIRLAIAGLEGKAAERGKVDELAGLVAAVQQALDANGRTVGTTREAVGNVQTIVERFRARLDQVEAAAGPESVREHARRIAADLAAGSGAVPWSAVIAALGWTGPPALAAVAGLTIVSRIVSARGRQPAQAAAGPAPPAVTAPAATSATAAAAPIVSPAVVVHDQAPPIAPQVIHDRQYVRVPVDNDQLTALNWALDDHAQRFPGAVGTVEAVRAAAKQFMSGRPRS